MLKFLFRHSPLHSSKLFMRVYLAVFQNKFLCCCKGWITTIGWKLHDLVENQFAVKIRRLSISHPQAYHPFSSASKMINTTLKDLSLNDEARSTYLKILFDLRYYHVAGRLLVSKTNFLKELAKDTLFKSCHGIAHSPSVGVFRTLHNVQQTIIGLDL